MKKIAVLSTDKGLNAQIESLITDINAKGNAEFQSTLLCTKIEYLEFLNYDLPEISIINFTDPAIDMYEILDEIKKDPWLHYTGIIIIHTRNQEDRIVQSTKNSNVISMIPDSQFDFSFPRVLRVLSQNMQIIYQKEIQQQLLTNISGFFVIDNDPFDIKTYSNLLCNYLFNANFISMDQKEKLLVTLMELLINAIEHGNCRVSHQEKSAWLETGSDMFELIRKKNELPEINCKKVYLEYRIKPDNSHITIKDEGDGFNWKKWTFRKRLRRAQNFKAHGHGIFMSNLYVGGLKYNDKGNEVSFILGHQKNESNLLPGVFNAEDEIFLADGDLVFREGEDSNCLYYIVSGKFSVELKQTFLSQLTPDDIFLGEMSFLLNNKRSATIKSVGRSSLLKITKKTFVNAIKSSPHYGLFLARLLAQRLERLNRLVK